MTLRKTLVLAIILCAVIGYILKVELPSEAAKISAGQIFEGLSKDQVSSIEISHGTESFSLENSRSSSSLDGANASSEVADTWKSWQIATIPGSQVDRNSVQILVSSLASLKLDSALDTKDVDSDLSVYGLQEPALRLKVESNGKSTEILFGKENQYVQKRYVKLGGKNELYLLKANLFDSANKKRDDFRNKTPIEFNESEIQELEIRGGVGTTVKLRANDQFNWRVIEPADYSASAVALETLGRELRGVKVSEFIDTPSKLSEFGLEKPQMIAKLVFRESAKRGPLVLDFGKVGANSKGGDSKTYLRINGAGTVFKLDKDPAEELLKPVDFYREKQLLKFATDQVLQVDFDRYKAGPVSIIKKDNGWTVNGKPGDFTFVNDLVREISELKADGFPSDNRDYGFKNPRLKVLVRLQNTTVDTKTSERLLVVGDSADSKGQPEARYYAAVDDLKEPFIISKESFKKIFPREDVLQKPPQAELQTPVAPEK